MSIESAEGAEEDLPLHAKYVSNADEFRDLFQLVSKRRANRKGKWRDCWIAGCAQRFFHGYCFCADAACASDEREIGIVEHQALQCEIAGIRIAYRLCGRKSVQLQGS